jgi:hypothetical protein
MLLGYVFSHNEGDSQRDNNRQHQRPGRVLRKFKRFGFYPRFDPQTDPHARPADEAP